MKVYARQGETVDAICFRHYGRTAGITEQVFESNPGLADVGAIVPHGYAIELPDQPSAPVTKYLQLWD